MAALPAPDYEVDRLVNFSYPCLIQTSVANYIHSRHAIAIGDGANDLPMMGTTRLSMAYHAKPRVREQAMVAINKVGLDRLMQVLT